MPNIDQEQIYDVAIIGAGPAGCTCALALKDAGLNVLLIDKSDFPRDKVCGDAIPGRAIKNLKMVLPKFESIFSQFPKKFITKHTKLIYNNKELTFSWVRDAYTCTRLEFDNLLFNLVKQHTHTSIFTGLSLTDIIVNADHVVLHTNTNKTFKAKIIVGADGALSVTAKILSAKKMNREHFGASVRAYYTGVKGLTNDTTYIYFDRKFLPSYFWVFPLPDNSANAGIGMQSEELVKRKANLKKIFYSYIQNNPQIGKIFKDATQTSNLEGFGLPLGSEIVAMSGNRFLLTGDAASLIDPASGDGIGNAVLSGRLAGEQIIQCFKINDFSAHNLKKYDKSVHNAIGKELKTHYRIQKLITKFPLILSIVFNICRIGFFKKQVQKTL